MAVLSEEERTVSEYCFGIAKCNVSINVNKKNVSKEPNDEFYKVLTKPIPIYLVYYVNQEDTEVFARCVNMRVSGGAILNKVIGQDKINDSILLINKLNQDVFVGALSQFYESLESSDLVATYLKPFEQMSGWVSRDYINAEIELNNQYVVNRFFNNDTSDMDIFDSLKLQKQFHFEKPELGWAIKMELIEIFIDQSRVNNLIEQNMGL